MRSASWSCLSFSIGLLILVWIVLFIRALVRRKLIDHSSIFFERGDLRDQWKETYESAIRIVGDVKRVRLIQGSAEVLPTDLRLKLNRFRFLHRATLALILIVIIFIFSAAKVCN